MTTTPPQWLPSMAETDSWRAAFARISCGPRRVQQISFMVDVDDADHIRSALRLAGGKSSDAIIAICREFCRVREGD